MEMVSLPTTFEVEVIVTVRAPDEAKVVPPPVKKGELFETLGLPRKRVSIGKSARRYSIWNVDNCSPMSQHRSALRTHEHQDR
jgi:hypothetical protein